LALRPCAGQKTQQGELSVLAIEGRRSRRPFARFIALGAGVRSQVVAAVAAVIEVVVVEVIRILIVLHILAAAVVEQAMAAAAGVVAGR
jgi:hypothetical protein